MSPWTHCAAPRPCPSNTPREHGTPACVCGAAVVAEAERALSGAETGLSRPNASQRLRDALAEQSGAVRRNDENREAR